ncbi:MAG: 3-dehydrotetronate 4-kinase, partial [Pseudonocardiales bacterium]|nr:3-dehydrotetronate 4-kinase [Pseudonocardiales bacterium]
SVRVGAPEHAAVPPLALRASQGPAAVVSGSCSTATLAQVERMSASCPTFQVDALALGDGQDVVGNAIAWASGYLPDVPVLVSASAPPEVVAQAQRELGTDRAAQLVEDALASIAAGLLELGVTRLVVAGGETSGAVVNRLGIGEVRIGPAIAPGVPWIFPTDRSGLVLALKSGNFGGRDFFVEALSGNLASA